MQGYKFYFHCIFVLALAILGYFGMELAALRLNDGFSVERVSSRIPYRERWDLPADADEKLLFKEISSSPFLYLGDGCQCFVFLSENKQYVLKFFKHYRWKMPFWKKLIEMSDFIDYFKFKKKTEGLKNAFESCLYATKFFKNETGIIFPHLTKSRDLPYALVLYDKLQRRIVIDPNDYEFVFQRYAEPADKRFLSLRKNKSHEKAEELFASLLDVVIARRQKGFNDKDPNLLKNFGFMGEVPVEMDIGGFYIDSKKDLTYFYEHELKKIQRKIEPWFKKNYPELHPFIISKLQFIYQNREQLVLK